MYDWEDRDKLMVGREIDLSTRISKDSPFLRTLAEQLTLMEFSIYAAIQRRYIRLYTHSTYTVCVLENDARLWNHFCHCAEFALQNEVRKTQQSSVSEAPPFFETYM